MNDRPRILILVTLAERGGAQTYLRALVPALVSRFDVTVASYGPGPLGEAMRAAGADYVALRHVRRPIAPRDALGLWELYRLCRRLRPDIVHANSSKAGVLGRLAAALARVPVRVFTVHGWAFKAATGIGSRIYLWCDRAMRGLTTAIVCVSETERSAGLAAKTCTDAQTVVVYNAVDADAVTVRAHRDERPVGVISVGRLAHPKDFVTLVRACARLEPGLTRLTIVGDGGDRGAVESAVAETGLEGVRMLGERDDVSDHLAASDVFVLSSLSEGLPMSVLEAMAAGLPLVLTRVGGMPELVSEGENGRLVPAGDPVALADAIDGLARDVALRCAFGAASRARVEETFALQRFQEEHVQLYERLLAGRPPRAVPA